MSKEKKPSLVTTEQIDRVVKVFYAKIRKHPTLGPIFNGIIGTDAGLWEYHEDKISRFWRNALHKENCYAGNPSLTHMQIEEIRDEHFTQWLDLFDTILNEELPEDAALEFSEKAHRIGGGLRRSFNSLGLGA